MKTKKGRKQRKRRNQRTKSKYRQGPRRPVLISRRALACSPSQDVQRKPSSAVVWVQHFVGFPEQRIEQYCDANHGPAEDTVFRSNAKFLRGQINKLFSCGRVGRDTCPNLVVFSSFDRPRLHSTIQIVNPLPWRTSSSPGSPSMSSLSHESDFLPMTTVSHFRARASFRISLGARVPSIR